ncbi:hypothetical protein CRE_01030 [Caenorhabditis remanei]|uniref:Uncharacterized protein n=2 Tax=Caenorhabditis TaxID=6237 RepID=E3MIG5_CAERE|nr:hypothetical protein CRE_01030 [Caenorhabditis remanei]
MWKSLFFLACLSNVVNGYLLSKSDPICRDETFLFFWKSNDPQSSRAMSPYDITSECSVYYQIWFLVLLCLFFLIWLVSIVPIIISFIEGTDRRTNCCHEKKKREKQKNGKD